MNIVYSCSNEYARHAGISIDSLLDHCENVVELNLFLINYNIDANNRQKLDSIAHKHGRTINYIPFSDYEELIHTDGSYNISKNSYARLFLSEMLPNKIDKVIWLDCDTIITDDITGLWDIELRNKSIAAVQDCGGGYFWRETGTENYYRYFCSGVFVANLKKWRDCHVIERFLNYIDYRNGHLEHVDQTVLNAIFYNDCIIVHPRYDALTPTFVMPFNNLIAYFNYSQQEYYSKIEIEESIRNPAIIHFTSSNSGRPWEKGCKHPKRNLYIRYWKNSPWNNVDFCVFKPGMDVRFMRTYWMYQHIPVRVINLLNSMKKRMSHDKRKNKKDLA